MPITNFKYENGNLSFDWLTDFSYAQVKVSKGSSCASFRLTMEKIPFWIGEDYESGRTVEITAYDASNSIRGNLQETIGPDHVQLEYSVSEKESVEEPKSIAKRIAEWFQGKGKVKSNQSQTKEFNLMFRLKTKEYSTEYSIGRGVLYYQVGQDGGRLLFPLPKLEELVPNYVLILPGNVDVGRILIGSTDPKIHLIKTQ